MIGKVQSLYSGSERNTHYLCNPILISGRRKIMHPFISMSLWGDVMDLYRSYLGMYQFIVASDAYTNLSRVICSF